MDTNNSINLREKQKVFNRWPVYDYSHKVCGYKHAMRLTAWVYSAPPLFHLLHSYSN